MILSEEEQKYFFSMYYPLLYYCNSFFKIFENINSIEDMFNRPTSDYLKIRDKIFDDKEVIKSYIENNRGTLGKNKIAILEKWIIEGKKVECLYIKKNDRSKFFDLNSDEKIKIIGISEDPDEMEVLNNWPLIIRAVILPFQKKIIWDGLFTIEDIYLDERVKNSLRNSIQKEI